MPAESERGCGYRKVGSLYLVGSGMVRVCDFLPVALEPCPHCGFEIPRHEGFMWVSKQYFFPLAETHQLKKDLESEQCTCPPGCPVCWPAQNDLLKYGLMWVGSKFYTPESFVKEAMTVGISKKISEIPKQLVMGKTWVMLAHKKVPFKAGPSEVVKVKGEWGKLEAEPIYRPAIFYGFKPERVEMPIWKKDATAKRIRELEDQGISPVIFEKTEETEKLHTRKIKRR